VRSAAHPVQVHPTGRRGRRRLAAVVLPLVLLAGCGGSDDAADSTSSTTASAAPSLTSSSSTGPETTTTSAEAGRVLQITVAGKQVTPSPGTVELRVGERLSLTVTSDVANELHIHGFEVEKELQPNQAVTVELVGQDRGTFEVETHHPELLLAKITVR
jgi:hypothetical protein